MSANYREPQFLLPNCKNLKLPGTGTSVGSGLTEDRHSLYSMDFDGNSSSITIGSNISISNEFTVSCWININTIHPFQGYGYILAVSSGAGFAIDEGGGSVGVGKFYFYNGAGTSLAVSTTAISANQWNNVAFVCNKTSNEIKCYINGSLDKTTTVTNLSNFNNPDFIGKHGIAHYINGKLDELAIFNRALSSGEVNDLWNGGSPSNPMLLSGKPVAYYPLGEQARKPGTAEWRFPNEILQSQLIYFDGNTDYINLDSAVNLGVNSTISFWYKTSYNNQGLVPFGGASGPYYYVVQWGSSVNKVYFRVGGTVQEFTGVTEIEDGNWHHYCITRTGANAELFIDGVSRDTLTGLPATTDTLIDVIGATSNGTSAINNSYLTQVAFWDSDQSANIANIYNYGAPQTSYTVTPTAWYKLDKTSTFTGLNANWHSALDFNGTSDRIDLSSSIDLGTKNTISAWVRNKVSQDRVLLGEDSYGSDFTIFGGYTYFLIKVLNSYMSFATSTPIIPINSDWAHIVFVRDGDNMSFYINGSLIGSSSTWTGGSPGSATTKFDTIGGKTNGAGTSNWLGEISNLAAWSQVISAEDVKYLYNGGTPQTNISFEPVSWWKLDNTGTGIQDSGSASNDGTNNGASPVTDSVAVDEWVFENTVQSQTPNWSSALDFDGSSHVEVSDSDSLSFGNGSTDSAFSVSTWVNFDDVTNSSLFSKSEANSNREYSVHFSNEKIYFALYSNLSNNYIARYYDTDLTSYEGSWVHFVFTYDGSRSVNGLKIYLNNSRIDDNSATGGTYLAMNNGTAPLKLGRSFNTKYLKGKQSNTQIWNTELSSTQVETLYNNGTPLTTAFESPVSWWKLNNLTTGIQDSVGSNNGTNNGATEIQTNVWTPRLNGESDTLPSTALVSSDLQFNSAYSSFSLNFDGANDYISVSNVSNIANNTQGSISLWINFAGGSNTRYCFGISDTDANTFLNIGINNAENLDIILREAGVNLWRLVTAGSPIVLNTWQHICLTQDGNSCEVYVDGVKPSQSGASTEWLNSLSGLDLLTIGALFKSSVLVNPIDGNISSVSIFDEALTSTEVMKLYSNGMPQDLSSFSPAPIAWWRLGEDAYFNGNDFIIPNQITGAPNGTSNGMPATALVADAPGSYAAGLGSSLALADRVGDAPLSTANSLSFNMTPENRISYAAGYTPAQVDNVYSMDFDSASSQYIDAGTSLFTGSDISSISISTWIKTTVGSGNAIISKDLATAGNKNFMIQLSGNDLYWQTSTDGSSFQNLQLTNAEFDLLDGNWHNIIVTYNSGSTSADGEKLIYVDGTLIKTDPAATLNNIYNTTSVNINIGRKVDATRYFDGNIDEVAIFDYALTPRQIKQDIYNATTSGKTADLNNNSNLIPPVAWYRMGD